MLDHKANAAPASLSSTSCVSCKYHDVLTPNLDPDSHLNTEQCGTCGVGQMEFCALHSTFMKMVEDMDKKVDQILSTIGVFNTAIELSKLDRSVLRKDIDGIVAKQIANELRIRSLEDLVSTGKGAMWMSKLIWMLIGSGVTSLIGFIIYNTIKSM